MSTENESKNRTISRITDFINNNLLKALLTYTLLVSGTIGFAYKFLIADSKIQKKEIEIEEKKSTIELYKAKINVLENENVLLRQKNEKYQNWLIQESTSLPFYEKKISELEEQLNNYKEIKKPLEDLTVPSNNIYSKIITVTKNESYRDKVTNLIFSVINMDLYSATVNITYPDDNVFSGHIEVGYNNKFVYDGKIYLLHVSNISWVYNTCTIEITEEIR